MLLLLMKLAQNPLWIWAWEKERICESSVLSIAYRLADEMNDPAAATAIALSLYRMTKFGYPRVIWNGIFASFRTLLFLSLRCSVIIRYWSCSDFFFSLCVIITKCKCRKCSMYAVLIVVIKRNTTSIGYVELLSDRLVWCLQNTFLTILIVIQPTKKTLRNKFIDMLI